MEPERSWWQKIKTHRLTILVVAIALVVVIALIIVGYQFDWTGFNGKNKSGKTLWDWMQLILIPAVLAVAGYVINLSISRGEEEATKQRDKTEHEIAEDNQREAALQVYIDKMSELLLKENLRESKPEDEVQKIARVRTLSVLPRLDPIRKRNVLQVLYESDLINKNKRTVYLNGADLSDAKLSELDLHAADLRRVNLKGANLSSSNLSKADLSKATLIGANLSGTNLCESNLSEAYLNDAHLSIADLEKANLDRVNLSEANLSGAEVTTKELKQAKSLQGATMPDGSILE